MASVGASGGSVPYSYIWSNGQTTSSISNLIAGIYSVTITDANGCTQIAAAVVTSIGGPAANVSANVTIVSGDSTVLAASGGGNYSWSTGETTTSIVVSPSFTTTYTIIVTDAGGCTDVAAVTVFVIEPISDCSEAESLDAFILPNAFSPNNDTRNDNFHLLYGQLLVDCVKEFYIAVYNRWGEKVFEGTTLNFSWDGTYKGKAEDTATFAYYMNAVLTNKTTVKKKGNISIIR